MGSFDDGVELQDGSIVSDVEAIKAIKKSKTQKTVYGKPMLDYKTMPKVVYKPADKDGVILPRDEFDEPYSLVQEKDEKGEVISEKRVYASDGAETTALISIMLGAIKENAAEIATLKLRIETLEAEIDTLKSYH